MFLRWLPIERARYFAQFEDRRRSAWYVYPHDDDDLPRQDATFFLGSVGVRCIRASDHNLIYENEAWLD